MHNIYMYNKWYMWYANSHKNTCTTLLTCMLSLSIPLITPFWKRPKFKEAADNNWNTIHFFPTGLYRSRILMMQDFGGQKTCSIHSLPNDNNLDQSKLKPFNTLPFNSNVYDLEKEASWKHCGKRRKCW